MRKSTAPLSLLGQGPFLISTTRNLPRFVMRRAHREASLPEMCPTTKNSSGPASDPSFDDGGESPRASPADSDGLPYDWRREAIEGGSLRHVDLHTGSNGWASPPGDLFHLRGPNYFSRRQKVPSGEWLLKPAGVDWLRSASRLDDVLGRPDNRVASSLCRARSLGYSGKAFLFAVNLQVPGRECHSAVFYFVAEDPIPPGSLFYRFVHGDDAFRNARFKIVNRIVKGPWIVKAAVGNYAACLLGKALTCNYHRGENYLEIDVDIGSSAIAHAILHLALGYVTAVTIDMGFLVEAQAEEELPERLLGAVRVAQMEMSSATYIETRPRATEASKGGYRGQAKVNHHQDQSSAPESSRLGDGKGGKAEG
ncbi:protein ENHANCED DISEASE RESISTANCE 2-like isoform X2 [Zingiber officinale]|uniref:protein ENHANCED DISEASE RESISTANCE 2-like isoform X2 n=1 Tax=Zingiber officinale TaxID=94328 RepID=UPI001C4CD09F|nr:protein ENHANCED DISEASE RESISTANCE 2-like isoform X2 [Zingiber officinale]